MAYDEHLADRVRRVFDDRQVHYIDKKMMGGLCFMVNDKMCCGILFDRKRDTDPIMARIGEEAAVEAMKRPGCHPMDFTGRPMKGFVFVDPVGFDDDDDLDYWIQLCLDFNPKAKKSRK